MGRAISTRIRRIAALALAATAAAFAPGVWAADPAPAGTPDAVVDLATRDGVALVQATWRYHGATIVSADFRSVGADRKPSGPPNKTYDIEPKAGAADFDDSSWETIDPASLDARRSTGKVCFAWYRVRVTVPERIAGFDPTGSTVVFETVVDDYAEVWADGKLPRELGQSGGSLVAGWNAPNRLVVGRDVKPGQTISLAVFAMNGPVSDPPPNYIWMRSARLEFHRTPRALASRAVPVSVDRLDPRLDALLPAPLVVEQIAEGFRFTEGPVWRSEGALAFSDPNANTIYRWTPTEGVSVFRRPSGYAGADVAEYGQPGSNGLTLDAEGRLVICEHGNHRISRLEKDGNLTVLADRFEGRRLNSPNDLVARSDGALYFTDPPFGLPKFHDDPRRELPFTGVFCLRDGRLRLVGRDLAGPNGLAFSPDEKYLYVTNWDEKRKVVMRYESRSDGSLARGRVFFDMTSVPGWQALDGLKVDRAGNLYVSGPGGIWVLSSEGTHLGTIRLPELPANFAWGDDGRSLYVTARTGVYRMRVNVAGTPPGPPAAAMSERPR